jgi:hypothetical protein
MNNQWIYRNGERPFSVTEIVRPDGEIWLVSTSLLGGIRMHYPSGTIFMRNKESDYDLIPYEPYSDYVIDDNVNVWDDDDGDILSGHFAGLTTDGKPTIFHNGGTSFTRHSLDRYVWNFCEKADKEDK